MMNPDVLMKDIVVRQTLPGGHLSSFLKQQRKRVRGSYRVPAFVSLVQSFILPSALQQASEGKGKCNDPAKSD